MMTTGFQKWDKAFTLDLKKESEGEKTKTLNGKKKKTNVIIVEQQ